MNTKKTRKKNEIEN